MLCCDSDTGKFVCCSDCDVGATGIKEDDREEVMVAVEGVSDVEDMLVFDVELRSEAWKLSWIKGAQRVNTVIVVATTFAACAGAAVIVMGMVRYEGVSLVPDTQLTVFILEADTMPLQVCSTIFVQE